MATGFTPYWKPTGPTEGPNSWVFFAVAHIAGRHRPVAVVSSTGDSSEPVESLQGYPLVACCRRAVTIFSDPENRAAVRAELALAHMYYQRGESRPSEVPDPVELPDLRRYRGPAPGRWRPWDHDRVHEFPFIAACLLQGVAFDPQSGRTCRTLPEPLGTVYRDSSLEWGMVVVDITDVSAVRYGIVGFPVHRARFVPSLQAENQRYGAMGVGYFPSGELRLVDEVHHRQAMAASEYMSKFSLDYENHITGDAVEHLEQVIPLTSADAMSLVWPAESDDKAISSPVTEFTTGNNELQSQNLIGLIRTMSTADDIKQAIVDEIRAIPVYKQALQRDFIKRSGQLAGTRADGRLIRLAFAQNNHLSLEQLARIHSSCVAAALDGPDSEQITSISICIDTISSTPAELVEVLSQVSRLRKIIFLQIPDRESDDASVRIFEELAARPRMLSNIDITLTGAYSAALRKRFWLPTTARDDAVQLAPLDVFPVQQILVRHQLSNYRNLAKKPIGYHYGSVYLGDALLKPERFASGFLTYLATLLPGGDDIFDSKAQLFSFSSCPGSPSADSRASSAQISPILAENWALPTCFSDGETLASPRVRDMVPEGWTVIVSQQMHWNSASSYSYSIQYAFVRPRRQRIMVDSPTLQPPTLDNLEVVGLRGFLEIVAPEIDPSIVERRLREVADRLAAGPWVSSGGLPSHVDPMSVFTPAEAAESLSDFIRSARQLNQRLREDMKEHSGGSMAMSPDRTWCYPELLRKE
ncbi:hypothetical protein F5Y14DRAFT_455530 [Nemania sp. NC0429]|nr:hypothetical protein F5Y14DRAFT_455530 [Nemania sp. NC0429]